MTKIELVCGNCGHEKALHFRPGPTGELESVRCRGYHDNSYDPYDADDDPCECTEYMTPADARRKDMSVQDQVIEFHRAFGHLISDRPTANISEKDVRLRARLIAEEALETLGALFRKDGHWTYLKEEIFDWIGYANVEVDLTELTDGLGDLDVVSEGTRLSFGIDGQGVAHRIHCSNMAKLWPCSACDGTGNGATARVFGNCGTCKGTGKVAVNDGHGKTIKPEGWQKPDIAGEIKRQQADPGQFGLLRKLRGL